MNIEGIELSHPDKVLFTNEGYTKKDIAEYYAKISSLMLPMVEQRPITMRRYPDGIQKEGFFNKHAPDYFPDFLPRFHLPMKTGEKDMEMIGIEKPEHLVYLANQNTIEFHISLSKKNQIDKPDQIIFDFDPSDDDFEKVRSSALRLKEILDELQLHSFVKTSGSKGLHVHLPIIVQYSFDEVKKIAKQISRYLNDECPDLTTLEQRKQKREGKVFIDYLRNDYGMTAIAPYSLRAKPGAPVAVPLDWKEVKDKSLGPQSYTIKNIFRRTAHKDNPWASFEENKNKLQPEEWND